MTERVTIKRYFRFMHDRSVHRGLTWLLAWAARQDDTCGVLGVTSRQVARRQFLEYTNGDHILLVALAKNRVVGLSVISHESTESLMLGHRVWEIKKMLVAPKAPHSTAFKLVTAALVHTESERGLLRARVAAWDGTSINALASNGFNVVTGQAVSIFHGEAPPRVRHPDFSFLYMSQDHLRDASSLPVPTASMSWHGLKNSAADRMDALVNNMLHKSMKNENCGAIVARHGEKLVGYVRFELPIGHWKGLLADIEPPVVLPEYTSRGVFELLVRRALIALSDKGLNAASVQLPVNEYSASRQLRSLRKLGFSVVRSDLLLRRWSILKPLGSITHVAKNQPHFQWALEKHISAKLGVQPLETRPKSDGSVLFVPSPPGGYSSSLPSYRRGEYSSP